MAQGSSTSSPDDQSDGAADAPIRGEAAVLAKGPVGDSVDPLTRQLRQMYGAIADEPVPAAIVTLLERLRQH